MSATNESSGTLPPEAYGTGLHQDSQTGSWVYVMPLTQGINRTTDFAFESIRGILDAQSKLPKAAEAPLKFVGSVATKHIAGAAISIVASGLFDTALADTLHVVGDVSLAAAREALEDAKHEPTLEGKRSHRLSARVHLETVYKAATKEIEALDRKIFPHTQRKIVEHRKAALAAVVISLINKDAGWVAARGWAEKAKPHFEESISSLKSELHWAILGLESMKKRRDKLSFGLFSSSPFARHPYKTKFNPGTGGEVRVVCLRSTAIRDVEAAVRSYDAQVEAIRCKLQQERSQFDALYQALTS